MPQPRPHIALLSLAQFDPRVRVGGAVDLIMRLRYLRGRGLRVSILDFLPNTVGHQGYDALLAQSGAAEVVHDGPLCRTAFRGLDYCHQILPLGVDVIQRQQRPAAALIQQALGREAVDYALTTDEGYWPLLAAYRAGIRGAHLFHTLTEVRRFARNPGYVWLLRHRNCMYISGRPLGSFSPVF